MNLLRLIKKVNIIISGRSIVNIRLGWLGGRRIGEVARPETGGRKKQFRRLGVLPGVLVAGYRKSHFRNPSGRKPRSYWIYSYLILYVYIYACHGRT